MTKFTGTSYCMLIDGKNDTLTFTTTDRRNNYCYNDAKGNLHVFPYPLAIYQLNRPFKVDNHEYVVLKKP